MCTETFKNFKPEKSRISNEEKSLLFTKGLAWCSKCKQVVTLEEISNNKSKYLGLSSNCKKCDKEIAAKRRLDKKLKLESLPTDVQNKLQEEARAKDRAYRKIKRSEKISNKEVIYFENPLNFKPKGKKINNEEVDYLFELGLKWCNSCKKVKDLKEFSKSNTKTGYTSSCKECTRKYRERNKETIKNKSKEYYEANKEAILEKAAVYREENADKIKEGKKTYYLNNKEAVDAKNKQHR